MQLNINFVASGEKKLCTAMKLTDNIIFNMKSICIYVLVMMLISVQGRQNGGQGRNSLAGEANIISFKFVLYGLCSIVWNATYEEIILYVI